MKTASFPRAIFSYLIFIWLGYFWVLGSYFFLTLKKKFQGNIYYCLYLWGRWFSWDFTRTKAEIFIYILSKWALHIYMGLLNYILIAWFIFLLPFNWTSISANCGIHIIHLTLLILMASSIFQNFTTNESQGVTLHISYPEGIDCHLPQAR